MENIPSEPTGLHVTYWPTGPSATGWLWSTETSGPTGPAGSVPPSFVSYPDKTDCSVLLQGPTRPNWSTGERCPAEMGGILSVEIPGVIVTPTFSTDGLYSITVTKTGLVNPASCV